MVNSAFASKSKGKSMESKGSFILSKAAIRRLVTYFRYPFIDPWCYVVWLVVLLVFSPRGLVPILLYYH